MPIYGIPFITIQMKVCVGESTSSTLRSRHKSSDYNYVVPKTGNANKAKMLLKESHKDEPQNMRNISAKSPSRKVKLSAMKMSLE